MAKATNALTQGISGKVTGLIFRRNANGTVSVGDAPRPTTKAPTAGALAQRQRFQQAAFYGRAVLQDPAQQAAYQTGVDVNTNSAYTVAVSDYLNAPDIRDVDFSAYHGAIGDVILIHATDDFAVARVHVRIQNPDGTLVEEGDALPDPDSYTYRYKATTKTPPSPATKSPSPPPTTPATKPPSRKRSSSCLASVLFPKTGPRPLSVHLQYTSPPSSGWALRRKVIVTPSFPAPLSPQRGRCVSPTQLNAPPT